jgi:hypothetical protein
MNLKSEELQSVGKFLQSLAKYEDGESPIFANAALTALNSRELSAVMTLVNPRRIDKLRDDRDG